MSAGWEHALKVTEAERDALRAEVADFTEAFKDMDGLLTQVRAEVTRLKAEPSEEECQRVNQAVYRSTGRPMDDSNDALDILRTFLAGRSKP